MENLSAIKVNTLFYIKAFVLNIMAAEPIRLVYHQMVSEADKK